ncbi:hypothetical protein HDU83_004086 [Entophlyctis luteolus]|nr:hypothetical protein HDU83_004086 [Entophlyctis luteolus]
MLAPPTSFVTAGIPSTRCTLSLILLTAFALVVRASPKGGLNGQCPPVVQAVWHPTTRVDPCMDPLLRHNVLCNSSLTYSDRAKFFVKQLTLEEKVAQMGNDAPGINRIGLPAYQWWNEALHGVCAHSCIEDNGKRYCATPFPTALAQAASFNMDLVVKIGTAISSEARAIRRFTNGDFGLNVWSPNINIYRDPRWGRGQETPGEDPFLTAAYAIHYIDAMQEKIGGIPKLYATVKHYAVYNVEKNRNSFNAVVSPVDLHQTFLPAFKASIEEGHAGSVMCAYNAVNGVPACANSFLLQELLRDRWSFDGFVVSDCDAVNDISSNHHFKNMTVVEASAASLFAGTDLDCGASYNTLKVAVEKKLIPESLVDESLFRLMKAKLELGIFDLFESQPVNQFPLETIDSAEHRFLARKGARQSFVLLKNLDATLPVRKPKSVAVIGPHSATTESLLGIYIPSYLAPISTIADGIKNAFTFANVTTNTGCDIDRDAGQNIDDAVALAAKADLTIICLGLDKTIEDEGRDRHHIEFPGHQLYLLKKAVKASKNKVVLVVIAGGSLDLSWAEKSDKVGAILYGFYPGEETANAVADLLLGHHSPAGRLPITFYHSKYINQVDLSAPVMREGPGRTYRFYRDKPLYPFGFGLSYTSFKYSVAQMVFSPDTTSVDIFVIVRNKGDVSSDHSVLAFVEMNIPECPLKQLFGFHYLESMEPGEARHVKFSWHPASALCVNSRGESVIVPGKYKVRVGDLVVDNFEVAGSSGKILSKYALHDTKKLAVQV